MPSRTLLIFALLLPLCTQAQSTISVADFGAQPDGILRTDGSITAGSSLLTSASGTFSPADAGKYIQIVGAGNGGTTHSDGVMASGSTTLTSISGTFAPPPKVDSTIVGLSIDVGRSIVVVGAGAGGQNLITHIAAFNSTTSVTLADPAISAAAGATYFYGAMTLEGTIQSVQDSSSVTLSTPAVATISNATYAYGTNSSALFQQAVDAAGQAGGATVLVPGATTCPAGAVCGYVIAATDQMTAHAPAAVKIRYNNVSLVGSDPQTNLFCRGAWGLYTNSVLFSGTTATIRGTCITIGDDEGANGVAGRGLSNVSVAKLHLYGMTDGNTYNNHNSPTGPPLTTTGDGWDTTHKAIALWQPGNNQLGSTFSNILIDSVYIQDFKGENIFSGGDAVTGMVIQNSALTNFNGDGISILAADLQVLNNTITNGSNAGIEDSTTAEGSKALVRQLYQGNTISDFPLEAIVIAGVKDVVPAGAVQIINNTFDTIGQINAFSGGYAIAIKPQALDPHQDPLKPNKAPANVTIAGNTCHDCYAFTWLQTSGHSQVRNNTIVVDHYSSGDLINLSFPMNDIVVANNSGDRTAEAAAKDRRVADVYNLHWANSTVSWANVLIHDNNWNFPGSPACPASPNCSYHYQFITHDVGWGAVNSQNIVWQNETCSGCFYVANHGLLYVADSLTIPPFGPVVQVQNAFAPVNVTVDASKEQDGAELTIIASGNQTTTFNPDANIALNSPLTVSGGQSVFFRYNGLIGKFVLAQRPTTISANANATPQSVVVNAAFGSALAATVLDSANNPVEGIAVEFTAPAAGASGTFANATNTTTALTDATGVATASAFSANSSAGDPYTVTATASGVATPATFSLTNLPPPVSITVQTSPTGQSFTVDNVAYASSQTFQWTPSDSHTIGTTATQAGSSGAQFVFASWSNSGAISQVILVPNAAAAYTANFNTQYQLTTSVNPAQGGTVTAGGWFDSGSGVQVQATTNPGYQFIGFSGDLTGAANPQTILMNAPNSVTANFVTVQTITFGALPGQRLGAAPFAVSATASSSLPISFNSQTTPVCTVSGSSVTLIAIGTCTIQATQAGDNTNYTAATPINQSFQVRASSLGTYTLFVGSAGGSSSVVVFYGGAWTAAANDSFLHISPGSTNGTGSGLVVFTYDPLIGTGTRTGTLTIAGLTLTVTQVGTNYIGPGPVTTLVSSGQSVPRGIAVDSSGNVYIADQGSGAISKWSSSTQQVTTLVRRVKSNIEAGHARQRLLRRYRQQRDQGVERVDAAGDDTGVVRPQFSYWSGSDCPATFVSADTNNNAIKEWSGRRGQVTTLVSAGLKWNPHGVASDAPATSSSRIPATTRSKSGTHQRSRYQNWWRRGWVTHLEWRWTELRRCLHRGLRQRTIGRVERVDAAGDHAGAVGLAPYWVAVDGSGNIYIADTWQQCDQGDSQRLRRPREPDRVCLCRVGLAAAGASGHDASHWNLRADDDQSWLDHRNTIATEWVNFSFTANTTSPARTAHITVLGQQITVTQNGLTAQTITFGALSDQALGSAPFAVSATASSGLAVSFASTTTSVCTVSGATVTLVARGTCTIQATQAGDNTYAAAPSVSQDFQVIQSQIITFGPLSNQVLGAAPFTVSATATSGLPVGFSSTAPAVCTVSNATVTLVALGVCTIQASQGGGANYLAATPVNQSFQVIPPGLGTYALLVGSGGVVLRSYSRTAALGQPPPTVASCIFPPEAAAGPAAGWSRSPMIHFRAREHARAR